jgi:predicted ribonuclease YlaK
VATATLLVKYGLYDGIIYIMSPTQEQAQGYLPGSIEEKSAPYMQPIMDALKTIGEDPMIAINNDENIQAQKEGRSYIDVCTDTFMRGINLEHKVVIIDEAQNFYFDQLKKVLTRIHDNSKTIVIGSSIQCDIIKHPERSGFVPYIKAFEKSGSDKCQICNLTINHRGWLSNFADAVMLKDYIST